MDYATSYPSLESLDFPPISLSFLPSIFCRAAGLIEGGNLNRDLDEGAMPLLLILFRGYSMLISVAKVITVIISGQCRLQRSCPP